MELALTTCETGSNLWTCNAWNPKNGSTVMTYKAGGFTIGPKTLATIRNEFIIAAHATKPIVNIWPINSQEPIQHCRFIMPGRVTALVISPDGNYCVAGVAENLYIWQIATGRMMQVLSRHYQSVTNLRFTSDGSFFISAGHDGMVFVWSLTRVLSFNSDEDIYPLYTFSDHALPITDMYIGEGGIRANLVTVSLDRTCKIYDLTSGMLLLNLVFREELLSVAVNSTETKLFVGTSKGQIHEFDISAMPRQREYHISDEENENKIEGHTDGVTCISISMGDDTLMSAGKDGKVCLWNIESKQLIRTLMQKENITNAMYFLAPKIITNSEFKLNLIVNNFKRMKESNGIQIPVEVLMKDDQSNLIMDTKCYESNNSNDVSVLPKGGSEEILALKKEIQKLKKINTQLYKKSVNEILK